MSSVQKEIYDFVLSGECESIKEHLERSNVTEEPQENDLFGLKDEAGRNALLIACTLGRSGIVRELVRNGAQVNEQTVRGKRKIVSLLPSKLSRFISVQRERQILTVYTSLTTPQS